MNEFIKLAEVEPIIENLKETFFCHQNRLEDYFILETDFDVLQEKLKKLSIVYQYLISYNNLSFIPIASIDEDLKLVKIGRILSFATINQIKNVLINTKMLKTEVENKGLSQFNEIWTNNIENNDALIKLIDKSIDDDCIVKDDASIVLKSLKNKVRAEQNRIPKILDGLVLRYKQSLADKTIYLKGDKQCLAIKDSAKYDVKGVVEDISSSGHTIYICPIEVVECYNKIVEINEEIEKEIYRIQKLLSEEINNSIISITHDYLMLKDFDIFYAKANFGKSYDGYIATLSKEYIIEVKDTYHLMLKASKIVKNNFSLGKDGKSILMISGPNAGGKTVALKTLAQAIILNQLGMMIPALSSPILPVFDNIFIVLGDDQSLLDNLSTFSGHINSLNKCLKKISSKSILIVDEICQGTSPVDGESLSVGIIKYIYKVGAMSVLTSHFEGLKQFCLKQDYILNGSMLYDEKKLVPLYKLLLNVVGKSYGIALAQRMGVNKDILDEAKQYMYELENTVEKRTLRNLENMLRENEAINFKLKNERKVLLQNIDNTNKEKKKMEEDNENYRRNLEQLYNEKIENEIDKIDELIKKNKKIIDNNELSSINKSLKDKIANTTSLSIEEVTYNIGDYVKIISSGNYGKIVAKRGNKYSILSKGLTYTTSAADIAKAHEVKSKKQIVMNTSNKLNITVPFELNVIGMHVEEAIKEVDKFIDSCIVLRRSTARIIHGFGTGVLRSSIQEFLNKSSVIKEIRNGGEGEGGLGATIVYFK